MNFIPRWIVTTLALAVAIFLVPGINMVGGVGFLSLLAFGLILSLVDMCIKPILQVLSLPFTILTFGIFYLIVNALVLEFAALISNGLFATGIIISGFWSAFFAAIVVSIASAIFGGIVDKN